MNDWAWLNYIVDSNANIFRKLKFRLFGKKTVVTDPPVDGDCGCTVTAYLLNGITLVTGVDYFE